MNSTINFKSITRVILVSLIVFSGATGKLVAQKQSVKKANIPVAIDKMEKVLGKWEGNVHSETGPVVVNTELKMEFNFSRMFNDMAIRVETSTENITKQKKSNGYGVIVCDTLAKELHLMLLNDSGAVYDLVGKWTNENSLNFTCNTEKNGKKIGITLWLIFKIKDSLEYSMYTSIGEGLLITEKGLLKRK